MDTVVGVLAGIFLVNVAIVAWFGVVLEVRRRRDQREIRELEFLYQTPSSPARLVAVPDGGRRWPQGKHVAPPALAARRQRILGTGSLALAMVSIGIVVAAALVAPVDGGRTSRAADDNAGSESGPAPTIDPARPTIGAEPRHTSTDSPPAWQAAIDEPLDLEAPGVNIVVSGGEEAVPAVLAAAPASATSILIDWEPVPDAIGYRVDRWKGELSASGEWSTIAETSAGVSMHTDTGLHAATTYYYRVAAELGSGEVAPTSDVVEVTTPPAAPTLSAEVAVGAVHLRWTDVADETGYRIERLASDGSEWQLIAATGEGIVTTEDPDLTEGISYQYRVIATGVGGDSAPSNVVEVVTPKPVVGGTPASEVPEPDAGAPDAIPDAAAPDAIDPQASAPDAIDPQASAPDAIDPDAAPSG
jgi:hypothetical protein